MGRPIAQADRDDRKDRDRGPTTDSPPFLAPIRDLKWSLMVPASMIAISVLLYQYDALAFHTLSEMFAFVIGYLLFATSWQTDHHRSDRFPVYLGTGYFWVATLDVLHTLSFKGMPFFGNAGVSLTADFWLSGRFLETAVIVSALLFRDRLPTRGASFLAFGCVGTLLALVALRGLYPLTFVEGEGLTPFKVLSEYAMIAALGFAAAYIYFRRDRFDPTIAAMLFASILMTMAAEYAFTLYTDLFGIQNMAGHAFKIVSYWLIYMAIVRRRLDEPYLAEMKAQAELNRSEQLFNQALDYVGVGVWEWEIGTGRLHWTRHVWSQFGAEEGHAEPSYDFFMSRVHPEDRQAVKDAVRRCLETSEGYFVEHRVLWPDDSVRWLSERGNISRGEDGTPVSMLGVSVDITHLKTAEDALRRAQKMETVGQLAGGIAHDFNNILGIVLGNLELLASRGADDPDTPNWLESARKGAMRGSALTRKLLAFSASAQHAAEHVSANAVIRDMRDLLEKSLTASISLKLELDEAAWPVFVERGDLEDALVNLALNARDAMPDGGALIIRTATASRRAGNGDTGARAGDFLVIAVADTGTGMSRAVQERVFEPFFTTKEQGKGTGLGLSMVYGFVRRAGGHVEVRSAVGRGTEIELLLPRASADGNVTDGDRTTAAEPPRGAETVLVVDDEPEILDIAAAQLKALGYNVLAAGGATEAKALLDRHDSIDLLFSDVIMPGDMDGFDLAEYARKTHPGIRVLLASGYSEKNRAGKAGGEVPPALWKDNMLGKPYLRESLAESVRRVLDGT